MDEFTVSQFKVGETYIGFLLVKSAEKRTSPKNGTQYVDMNLADRTGEINCKIWDGNAAVPAVNSVVKVKGLVQEYNGRLQFRIEQIRPATKDDNVDMARLTCSAPESSETMMKKITDTVESFRDGELKKLVGEMLRLAGEELNYYPAAQRMHHAERGGLLHHTTSMMGIAEAILQVYSGLNRDLLLAGVIIHDLAKINEMQSDNLGNVADYTADGQLIGHLVRGVVTLNKAAENTGVNGEIVLLLEHMLLSHHGESEYGSPKPPMFAEAEALHWIDMMDARMNSFRNVTDRTPAGAFSERIPSLERRVYHPKYGNEDQ